MRTEILTPPEGEPITLEEAKLNTRITLDDDDDVVTRLISSAREYVEKYINRALLEQTWVTYLDLKDIPYECRKLLLPYNATAIESITTYNDADSSSTFATSNYFLSGRRICLKEAGQWPTDLRTFDCMVIQATVGYGDEATDIPTSIMEAMYKLIAHGYEHREAYFDSTDPVPVYSNVPYSVTAMLQPFRIYTTI